MANIVLTSDGHTIDLDSLELNYTYNGDGTLNTTSAVYRSKTYKQTNTYTASKLTKKSAWILQ